MWTRPQRHVARTKGRGSSSPSWHLLLDGMEGSSSLHGLAGACAVWTPLLEHHGAHMIGEVLLSTASVQLFSVSVFIYWTWRVSTATVGLWKWSSQSWSLIHRKDSQTWWSCCLSSCKTSEGSDLQTLPPPNQGSASESGPSRKLATRVQGRGRRVAYKRRWARRCGEGAGSRASVLALHLPLRALQNVLLGYR